MMLVFGITHLSAQERADGSFFVRVEQDSVWARHFTPAEDMASGTVVLLVPGWPAAGSDVLGLGAGLSARGLHVLVVHPRGHEGSSGQAGFTNGLDDVETMWRWLHQPEAASRLGMQPRARVLVGYSWGGGIALAYAAQDTSVRRVASIAGSDHGVFIRRFDEDAAYGDLFRQALLSTRAPDGPVRFDLDASLNELRENWQDHDLVSIAGALVDRDLLLLVGWDDEQVELEHQVLPFYRALRSNGARALRVVSFQDGHGFRNVRSELRDALYAWVVGPASR